MSSGEYCGDRMMAATSLTPASARLVSPPWIDGSEKRIPMSTGHPSERLSAAAWARVISISGEPPMTR